MLRSRQLSILSPLPRHRRSTIEALWSMASCDGPACRNPCGTISKPRSCHLFEDLLEKKQREVTQEAQRAQELPNPILPEGSADNSIIKGVVLGRLPGDGQEPLLRHWPAPWSPNGRPPQVQGLRRPQVQIEGEPNKGCRQHACSHQRLPQQPYGEQPAPLEARRVAGRLRRHFGEPLERGLGQRHTLWRPPRPLQNKGAAIEGVPRHADVIAAAEERLDEVDQSGIPFRGVARRAAQEGDDALEGLAVPTTGES